MASGLSQLRFAHPSSNL